MSFLLEGEFIHETDSAILVNYKDENHWIPKKHCSVVKKELCFDSGNFELILKLDDWLAYKKRFSNFKPTYDGPNHYHNTSDHEEDGYWNCWDAHDPNY